MKIAAFDTIHHPTPILREFGIGFEDLGYEFNFYNIHTERIGACVGKDYDYIFYVGDLDYCEIKEFKRSCESKIIYAVDGWRVELAEYRDFFHSLLTTQTRNPEFEEKCAGNKMNLIKCPLAGNNRLFFKAEVKKDIDISFIGTLAHGDRGENRYLYPVIDSGKYNVFLGGMTYKGGGVPFVPYAGVNEIRNRSKINLNFHTDYQKGCTGRVDLNQSIYNIALAGGFQICDHPEAKVIFEGSVVVPDDEDWMDCIDYYINRPEEREILAAKSIRIANRKHTWKERIRELCSKL